VVGRTGLDGCGRRGGRGPCGCGLPGGVVARRRAGRRGGASCRDRASM